MTTRQLSDLTGIVTVTDTAYGALADGSTDDSTAIQAAIDSGAKALHFPKGTYIIGTELKPVSNQTWIGEKGQSILKISSSASASAHIVGHNADGADGQLQNWHAQGLVFDGNSNLIEGGLVLNGCDTLTVKDCVFKDCQSYGFGLQASPGGSVTAAQDNIWIIDCEFKDNGAAGSKDGLDIKYCTNAYIIGCSAEGNAEAGFGVVGQHVTIADCISNGDGTGFRIKTDNTAGSYDSRMVISNCIALSAGGVGFQFQSAANNDIHINASSLLARSNTTRGIEISGDGKLYGTFANCTSEGNTEEGLNIVGDDVGNLVVSGCLFLNNTTDGISTTGKNTLFSGCIMKGNTVNGYQENTGADNNHIAANCIIDGNGTDIAARVGAETENGFLSVRDATTIRAFPGQAAGLEIKTDNSTDAEIDAVGTGSNIDLKLSTKGIGRVQVLDGTTASKELEFDVSGSSASTTTTLATASTASRTLTLPDAADTLVGKATTDTLTNKSIDLTNNTLTGSTAEFNTALSDGSFATLAGTETLTNKTINTASNTITVAEADISDLQSYLLNILEDTSPQLGGILDTNGNDIIIDNAGAIEDDSNNEYILFSKTASAVNEITVANAAAGSGPTISATGGDTNVDLNIAAKGAGQIEAGSDINIETSSNPTLRIYTEDLARTSYSEISDKSANQLEIFKVTNSGAPQIDLRPNPTDGSSSASVRFFRSTNTSGSTVLNIYLGDNSGTINARIAGQGTDSYVCANNGDFGVGTSSPGGKLEVSGGLLVTSKNTATIATGAITATANIMTVDTESAAASDDLDTINGGVDGAVIHVKAANAARTVVAKDGTGNLILAGDFSLDNTDDVLTLMSDGTNWREVSRSDNGA